MVGNTDSWSKKWLTIQHGGKKRKYALRMVPIGQTQGGHETKAHVEPQC